MRNANSIEFNPCLNFTNWHPPRHVIPKKLSVLKLSALTMHLLYGWRFEFQSLRDYTMLNSISKNLLYYIVFFFYLTGCGAPESSDPQEAPITEDISVTLNSNLTNVNYNGSITLIWSTSNVDSCVASGDWSGSKSITTGSETISSLTTDSTFILTCTGINGDTSDAIYISVGAPATPSVTLSANPTTVAFNGSTTLSWTSSNVDSCVSSGSWSGNKDISGSQSRNSLTSEKTYTLTCSGANGTASDSVTITVGASSATPTVNLSASLLNVPYDGSTTLNWSSNNVTSCTASGDWSGSKATSGSQIISALTTNSNFGLTCSGAGGSANDSVSIILAVPTITVNLSASPSSVVYGGSTTLNWSSSNASSCTASGDWSGDKGTSDSQVMNSLVANSTFNLSCTGPGGTVTRSLLVAVYSGTALPAFPGAEGFGAASVGGRGGRVIKVTNLNNSGAGSLREALTTPEPRIVVFEVSGIINLMDEIRVDDPYLTVAGETSPGGIMVTGRRVILQANDIIIRHMRFRVGSHRIADGVDPETLDSLNLYGSASGHPPGVWNVIIDHSSISWGVDESFTSTYAANNVTIQWSIISEGLSNAGHPKGEHSKGFLASGKFANQDINISFHHNYLAHNVSRNPEVGAPANGHSVLVDVRNNVVYNWYHALTAKSNGRSKVNWIENYMKKGPDSNDTFPIRMDEVGTAEPAVYVYRNIGPRDDGSDPEIWNVGTGYSTSTLASTAWRATAPHSTPAITTSSMSDAYAIEMLSNVGATAPVRDSVDERVVNDFANGTGSIRDNVTFPDDFPVFATPAAPVDNDNDGMADVWETANGFNTSSNDSAGDADGDGYTNIEEYLHQLAAGII